MSRINAITPVLIHQQLRFIVTGNCAVLASRAFLADQGDLQIGPEAPPNEVAAAEIQINTGPTGLNNPDIQIVIPLLRYGTIFNVHARRERSEGFPLYRKSNSCLAT
jgi:hypothetical protein